MDFDLLSQSILQVVARLGASLLQSNSSGGRMAITQELLDLLVCPVCKTPVKLTPDGQGLRCPACRVVYPIRDGFPVMIKEEARPES
jgi:uncharacterized protein YbaR (Trm112 family)